MRCLEEIIVLLNPEWEGRDVEWKIGEVQRLSVIRR